MITVEIQINDGRLDANIKSDQVTHPEVYVLFREFARMQNQISQDILENDYGMKEIHEETSEDQSESNEAA